MRAASLVVIVPSRGRPQNIRRLLDAWEATVTTDAALLFGLDSDDVALADSLAIIAGRAAAEVGPRKDFGPWINHLGCAAACEAPIVGAMGDDHLPRTKGWDRAVVQTMDAMGGGLVYGDDGLQHERLPTAGFLASDIVRTLGCMSPGLEHFYIDNFWLDLCRALGRVRYLPEVVIEHMHPVAGKGEQDALYLERAPLMNADAARYALYRASSLNRDVARLRAQVA